jgi:hypothetical protein
MLAQHYAIVNTLFFRRFLRVSEPPNFSLAMVCKHEYLLCIGYEKEIDMPRPTPEYDTPLGRWCVENKVSSYALGEKCGVAQSCAYRWMVGETRPDWLHIPRITAFTDGAITANDFVPTDD